MNTATNVIEKETQYGMEFRPYEPTETVLVKLKEDKKTQKIQQVAFVVYKRNIGIIASEMKEINHFDYKDSLKDAAEAIKEFVIKYKPQVVERKNIGLVMWDEEGRIFKNELKKIGYNEQQFETLNIEPVVTKKLLCLKHRKIKIEDAAKISSIKFKDEDDALTNAIKVIKIEQEARKHWTKLGREKVYTYELSQDIYKKTYDLQSKILIQFEEKMNEVRKINRELFIQGELKVGTTEQELIEIMSERINVKKRKEIKMRDIVLMKHNYPRLQEIYKKQNKEFLENEKETIKLKEKFELIEEKISEYYFKRNEQSRLFLLNVLDTKREIEKFETLEVMNFKKEHLIKVEERIEEVKKQLSYLEQMTI